MSMFPKSEVCILRHMNYIHREMTAKGWDPRYDQGNFSSLADDGNINSHFGHN